MKRSFAAAAAAFLLSASASAFAHGGMEHVMGTVKSVSASSITVATKEKDVEVKLDEATKYEGAASSAADLKPGERVVVHAKRAAAGLHAEIVKSRAAHGEKPAR
jgi:preprotein translocase subunit YajC